MVQTENEYQIFEGGRHQKHIKLFSPSATIPRELSSVIAGHKSVLFSYNFHLSSSISSNSVQRVFVRKWDIHFQVDTKTEYHISHSKKNRFKVSKTDLKKFLEHMCWETNSDGCLFWYTLEQFQRK